MLVKKGCRSVSETSKYFRLVYFPIERWADKTVDFVNAAGNPENQA